MKILDFVHLIIDRVYAMDHFVTPGETISSSSLNVGCGGKGLTRP